MDTRQLIPLLLLVGLVCFSYHSLTASPARWGPLHGRLNQTEDQTPYLSWVVDQFQTSPQTSPWIAACHPGQTPGIHSAWPARSLSSIPQTPFWLSWLDTTTFLRQTTHRAERPPERHRILAISHFHVTPTPVGSHDAFVQPKRAEIMHP